MINNEATTENKQKSIKINMDQTTGNEKNADFKGLKRIIDFIYTLERLKQKALCKKQIAKSLSYMI